MCTESYRVAKPAISCHTSHRSLWRGHALCSRSLPALEPVPLPAPHQVSKWPHTALITAGLTACSKKSNNLYG